MRVVQRDSNNGVDPTYLARLAEEYKKSTQRYKYESSSKR